MRFELTITGCRPGAFLDLILFHRTSSSSPSSYSESEQRRDLEYLKRLPASQNPDAKVVNRLMAYGLIFGIDDTMSGDSAMVWLTPRGGALMEKASGPR